MDTKLLERFWLKVNIPEENMIFSCWEWIANKHYKGYGCFRFNTKYCKAHRISYLIFNGNLPNNLCCHSCDNPTCVNPFHLFDGTASDNMKDMINKGRGVQPHTETHHKSKLTNNQVQEIRNREIKWGSVTSIAKEFNVSKSVISSIINVKTWKSI